MTEVEWRTVPEFPKYEVSSDGYVRSARFPGRLLKFAYRPDGRRQVTLYRGDGTHAYFPVHRLVALAFLGPKPDWAFCVRHLNDIPTDNRVENLAYGTRRDNSLDSVRNGLHNNGSKPECSRGHSFADARIYYRKSGGIMRICRECTRIRERAAAAAAK